MTSVLMLAMLLTLGGCATVPPPDGSMNLAQSQLQAARDAGAADYAPVDFGFAQDKFQQAQLAVAERKYAIAATLAEESRADAELARAKARLGAARAQIQNKVQENARLRAQGEAMEAASQRQAMPQDHPVDDGLPPAEPVEDMPAPDSSVLAPPTDGFQTMPTEGQPSSGGQP